MSTQTIYNQLRAAGCSPAGALALLGNWACESANESCRLQGDFTEGRTLSREYAEKVDRGQMSEDTFAHDGKGWGLAQWTFPSRKAELLRFCRQRGVSIADEQAQVDFAVWELQNQYPILWQYLCSAKPDDLYDAVERVCTQYERPAYNNVDNRYQAALRIRDNLREEDEDPDEPDSPFWPPRMLDLNMVGADVQVVQSILLARGYAVGGVSGIYDTRTRNMVMAFQAESGLIADGVCGPKTWRGLVAL